MRGRIHHHDAFALLHLHLHRMPLRIMHYAAFYNEGFHGRLVSSSMVLRSVPGSTYIRIPLLFALYYLIASEDPEEGRLPGPEPEPEPVR